MPDDSFSVVLSEKQIIIQVPNFTNCCKESSSNFLKSVQF